MDYQEVNRIMLAKGLNDDPAFDALRIAIEPIPCTDTCPLGLYFPDTPTVILPPDATEGALFHELGHRHGHFWSHDLSERYAERFRKMYQKGRALLYLGNDLNRLPSFGGLFEEGEKGAVEVALLQPLTPDELYQMKSQLYSYGEIPKFHYHNSELPIIRVEFTKGVDWTVIIAGTLAGLSAVTTGLIGYAIYKIAKDMPWITPVVMFGAPAAILLLLGLGAKYAPQIKGRLAEAGLT